MTRSPFALAIVISGSLLALSLWSHAPSGAQIPPGTPPLSADMQLNPPTVAPLPPLPDKTGRSEKLASVLDDLQRIDAQSRRATGRAITRGDVSRLPDDLRSAVDSKRISLDDRGTVQVYVETSGPPADAVPDLQALGMTVERTSDDRKLIQGRIPISSLTRAASLASVNLISPPERPVASIGAALTQGDAILQAASMRSAYAVDGTGVKVGVLSDGAEGLAASKASGDLPNSVDVTTCDVIASAPPGEPANTTDAGAGAEGTAMAEIVHDLAPGAQIMIGYFGFNVSTATDLDFMAAVNCLAQNNDIVVDDIGWFNEGLYDGTSPVSQNTSNALNNVGNAIRGYYTAAANQADRHYEAPYVDSAPADSSNNLHVFAASGTTTDVFALGPQVVDPAYLTAGSSIVVFLEWNDPFNTSSNDYDVYLFRENGNNPVLVAASTNVQTGSQHPVEALAYTNTTGSPAWVDIVIDKYSGAAKNLEVYVFFPQGCTRLGSMTGPCLNYNTAASSVPNNADAGGGVVSVGAIDAADPGNNDIELYSSRGPTNDGRLKPEITGIDGVAITGAGGFFNPFYGTSAAAPHAAGIAALLLSCNPALKKGEPGDNPATDRTALRNALLNSATDLGAGGADNTYGYGRLNALNAAPLAGCAADVDADGIPQFSDNCPNVANANQLNTDAAPIVTAGIQDDITRPNGDGLGDACDADKDNDGFANTDEANLGPAGPSHGLCPSATAATDPLKLDTDGDRVTDRAECLMGYDPANAASKPPVPIGGDTDHDGLPDTLEVSIGSNPNAVDTDADWINDAVEFKGYNTSPMSTDTDGDGCSDGREIGSVNADKKVNSSDLLVVAQNYGTGPRAVLDVTKDGKINSSDLLLVARNFGSTPC